MKPETEPVAAVIQLTKADTFPSSGLYVGPSGYAPYHDLASDVPSNVDSEMQAILKGLNDGSITTNVPPVKPSE